MTLEEGNKLIAEFMVPNWKSEYESGEIDIDSNLQVKMGLVFDKPEMWKYHSSWNNLMPVVDKIGEIDGIVTEIISSPTISKRWMTYTFKVARENRKSFQMDEIIKVNSKYDENEPKIQLVWRGVIEFIKRHNLQSHV